MTPCREVSVELSVPPLGKENTQSVQPATPNNEFLCGSSYSNLTPWRLQGYLLSSTTGNLCVTEKEERAYNNEHINLGTDIIPAVPK